MSKELCDLIRLTAIRGVGSIRARHLIETFGNATAVLTAPAEDLMQLGSTGQAILYGRNDARLLAWAERELQFINDHHVQVLIYGEPNYPKRLLDCPDAPIHLFKIGDIDLDRPHVVSIVGTRKCSAYGRDMVQRFVSELRELLPDVIIVSGLAYGIDVESHRASLANQVPTVGVVAHGLDRIYPQVHRETAHAMVHQGGAIVTEYPTGTTPERGNFLARNRIIAGLADAVLVAESQDRGGSLVTASIGLDYGRDIFAFPGRVTDDRSNGCNRLIRLNRAGLITCAQDLVEAMNWTNTKNQPKTIQRSIPFEEDNLSEEARLIVDALRSGGDLLISQLSAATGLDHATLYEQLMNLEIDGRIRTTPGGLYQLR